MNGKISTMDASNREVQALAVKSNRIIAVGMNNDIRFLAGPNTEVLDAKGRRVLPGLIDGHTHPHLWAVEHWLGGVGDATAKRYNDPQLQISYAMGNDPTEVLRNLERNVRERSQALGPNKWIWITLYGGKNLPESRMIAYPLFRQEGGQSGTVTRQFLDTLAPNNPLMVHSSEAIGPEEHNTQAKDEMLKILGWEASGLTSRTGVLYDILFRGRTEEKVDFLKRELLECVVSQGVTTFGNHYYGTPSIMKTYNILYQRGELPVRWAWYEGTLWGNQLGGGENTTGSDNGDLQFFYRNLGDFRGIGNDYIWNAGVSNEAWETGLRCTTAKPTKPNAPSGVRRDCNAEPTIYDEAGGYQNVKAALENGLRISFLHTYSDGTYESLLHLLDEEIAKGNLTLEQVRALRIGTEHNPIIRPDHIKKLANYGVRPAFNGYQVQGDIKGGEFLKVYGEQVMTWMAPMKSLVDAGGHPVFNTDAHLGKVPYYAKDMQYPDQWDNNIWGFVEFFVTRKMPHDGITYNRAEAMDRVNMMRAATIWGAEQALNEKNIGSLEAGKLADFIVIDKDFFTIPDDQIHTIKTLLTAVGGKVVFKDSSY
ncbi:MAG: amidohydrolase family protein [Acidobacteria bacterium]|nr:amidohydrolase family protein [Acidobacteriota bacterium]